jgi:hypothetical protein
MNNYNNNNKQEPKKHQRTLEIIGETITINAVYDNVNAKIIKIFSSKGIFTFWYNNKFKQCHQDTMNRFKHLSLQENKGKGEQLIVKNAKYTNIINNYLETKITEELELDTPDIEALKKFTYQLFNSFMIYEVAPIQQTATATEEKEEDNFNIGDIFS